jgi:hypothetical protein
MAFRGKPHPDLQSQIGPGIGYDCDLVWGGFSEINPRSISADQSASGAFGAERMNLLLHLLILRETWPWTQPFAISLLKTAPIRRKTQGLVMTFGNYFCQCSVATG